MHLPVGLENWKRYGDIARLLVKHGRGDFLKRSGLAAPGDLEAATTIASPPSPAPAGEARRDAAADSEVARAEALAADLERLGPTFVKLGQLLSTRPDLLPPAYIEALSRLQDQVEPFSFAEVERIVAQELGVRLSKGFSEFEAVPVAAASLGQVHRAALRDGRVVAVKVQRPDVRDTILPDLDALAALAELADRHTEAGQRFGFSEIVREFRRALLQELDYGLEARNLATLAANLAEFPRLVVPRPIEDYCTTRVLTSTFIEGHKITEVTGLERTELDGRPLAEELFRAYLKQVLVDGFFHADPHPGNVLLTDDGRIALLDLGLVAWVAPAAQERLLQLLLAISEGRGEDAAGAALALGERREGFEEAAFRKRVTAMVAASHGARLEDLEVGQVMLGVTRACGESGVRVPSELSLLAKTLLALDQVGRTLDTHFEPNAAIRRHALDLTRRRLWKSLSPGHALEGVLEAKDFLWRLPRRVNRILDNVAGNQLRLRVDSIDEHVLVHGFQKVANRIAMGLVLAALIVGAGLLMRVETAFRIFGYPGLAMVLFLLAAGGGFALLVSILVGDRDEDTKPTTRAS